MNDLRDNSSYSGKAGLYVIVDCRGAEPVETEYRYTDKNEALRKKAELGEGYEIQFTPGVQAPGTVW